MKFISKNWIGHSLGRLFFDTASDDGYINAVTHQELGSKNPIYIDCNDLEVVYHQIPHLKLVINTKAQMLSNGTWKHYTAEGVEIPTSKYLDVLSNPNVLQGGRSFITQYSINEDLYGTSFIYVDKGLATRMPQYMWCLPSKNIVINRTGKIYKQSNISDIIEDYELREEGGLIEKYAVDEIIRLKTEDDNLIVGTSKVNTLRQQISNIKHAYDSRNVAIVNRGTQGILSALAPQPTANGMPTLTPIEKKEAESKLQNDYGTGRNQNRVGLTTLDVKYTDLSAKIKDLMLFEEIQDDFCVIIDTYGLNKNMFAAGSDNTYENVSSGERQAYQNTIIPQAKRLSEEITKMYEMDNGEYLELDYSHLAVMQEDEKSRADVDKVVVESLNRAYNDKVISGKEYRDNLPSSFNVSGELESEQNVDEVAKALFDASLKLRGTVGGVDGIISINESVSMGQMSRDTAVNLLTIVYQYSQEDANRLITNNINSTNQNNNNEQQGEEN
jgi:hypothetical protein